MISLETSLGPLGGVHLVDGDDELLDTKSVGEKSVLTSLAILGDTSLELTSTSSNDENSAVSLRSTSDHVLDEITVTRGVYSTKSEKLCAYCREGDIPMTVT